MSLQLHCRKKPRIRLHRTSKNAAKVVSNSLTLVSSKIRNDTLLKNNLKKRDEVVSLVKILVASYDFPFLHTEIIQLSVITLWVFPEWKICSISKQGDKLYMIQNFFLDY